MDKKNFVEITNLLPKNIIPIKFYDGFLQTRGKTSGKIYNKYAFVRDINININFYVIYCYPNNITYISENDIDKVIINENNKRKYTWYYHIDTGYIYETKTNKTIHQIIMNYYGHGTGKEIKTIDHINQNKLDNRRENLRIISQSEQNKNCGKRKRQKNAKPLPDELVKWLIENRNTDNLPKFMTYYSEYKNDKMIKEFFKIEKYKTLQKPWSSPKGILKNSIIDKYIIAENMLKELNNNNPEHPKIEYKQITPTEI